MAVYPVYGGIYYSRSDALEWRSYRISYVMHVYQYDRKLVFWQSKIKIGNSCRKYFLYDFHVFGGKLCINDLGKYNNYQ